MKVKSLNNRNIYNSGAARIAVALFKHQEAHAVIETTNPRHVVEPAEPGAVEIRHCLHLSGVFSLVRFE